jgi:hypothetical protein
LGFYVFIESLQSKLTYDNLRGATTNPQTRYLINEIVVAEESDLTIDGQRSSHYEMYIEAMKVQERQRSTSEVNSLFL